MVSKPVSTERSARLHGGAPSVIEPWFQSGDFENSADFARLTDEEVTVAHQLRKDGFATIDVHAHEGDDYFDRFLESLGAGYRSSTRAAQLWKHSQYVRDLACNKRILNLLRKTYGREPFPFQTLNFPRGSEQATHSDTIHFNSYPENFMCGVWFALEDVTLANGPLHYYPGSHLLPRTTLYDLGFVGNDQQARRAYQDYYEPFVRRQIETHKLERVELQIKRGQALIWCANLLHGGSPIISPGSTRHSQVTHYFFEDCVYYTPMFSNPMTRSIRYRSPVDIRNGRMMHSRYLGKKVSVPYGLRLREWAKYLRDTVTRSTSNKELY